MREVAAFTLVVGLFLYLTFVDIYEYPKENFKAGKEIISKSAFYDMKADNAYYLDGQAVSGKTFAEQTDYVVCINGQVHLICDLWAWVYYCWELLIITLLCIIWYKLCTSKFFSQVALFCATVWSIRLTWQLLLLFNLVPNYDLVNLSKGAAKVMLFMILFLLFLNKIRNTIYEQDKVWIKSD